MIFLTTESDCAVVLRYRFQLEERGLTPGTINMRMAAVRRLAYEATDSGLLSPELAACMPRCYAGRSRPIDGRGIHISCASHLHLLSCDSRQR
jgi:hypothetical protein